MSPRAIKRPSDTNLMRVSYTPFPPGTHAKSVQQ